MAALHSYTEADIRLAVDAGVFARGRDYCHSGRVQNLVQRGSTLQAEVQGSEYDPYEVSIWFNATGIEDADCTCPYDMGWCKHIVATLLAALEKPKTIEIHPGIDELLQELPREQLYSLLLQLVKENPSLAASIESRLAQQELALTMPPASASGALVTREGTSGSPPLDERATRQLVRKALRGVSKVEAASQLIGQVQSQIEAGQVADAGILLESLTDEFISSLPEADYYEDDYGNGEEGDDGSYELLEVFDEVWAEWILSADLAPERADDLADQLAEWDEIIEGGDRENALSTARLALEYGWDYPPLQRVLQGEITERGAWEAESPYAADELALVRLRILERQGRTQEYLYLAEAEGQIGLYAVMLAKVGRTQEAVSAATQYLATVDAVLAVAQALQQQGAIESAIEVANHGLALPQGPKHALAKWLQELYLAQGDIARAMPPAIMALAEQPNLAEYRRLQSIAGENWANVRAQILSALRTSSGYFDATNKAEIFLSEELWDDAIAVADQMYGRDAIRTIMERVSKHRPDWVIRKAQKEAEGIMNAGQAQHYDEAVNWLRYAKRTYQAGGRSSEWERYLKAVKEQHHRKYKLMGLLRLL
jgi:uncharacterized Zn finger protein